MIPWAVVGVDLVDLGMNFDNCGSIRAPFHRVLVSVGIEVELGKGGLHISLLRDGHNVRIEFLSEGQLLVSISLT